MYVIPNITSVSVLAHGVLAESILEMCLQLPMFGVAVVQPMVANFPPLPFQPFCACTFDIKNTLYAFVGTKSAVM